MIHFISTLTPLVTNNFEMQLLCSIVFLAVLVGFNLSFKLKMFQRPSNLRISSGQRSNLVGKAVIDTSELETVSSSDMKIPANAPSSSASTSSVQPNDYSEPVLSVKYDDVWMVDSDSAELEVESSLDKKRKRELIENAIAEAQAKVEADAKTAQQAEALRNELESQRTRNPVRLEETVGPVTLSPALAKISQMSHTSNESSGFDIGLLIAFPLMIGTLGFFLFFPYVGEILSGASSSSGVSVP